MQATSGLYKELIQDLHTVQTSVSIETVDGFVSLLENEIYSVRISGSLFPDSSPSVGNFCSRELDLVIIPPELDIPRMAEIQCYIRLTDGVRYSEWVPKGVFYIDTRNYNADKTKMSIHAYDAALKFDSDFDSSNLSWPALAENVIVSIANSAGVAVSGDVVQFVKQFTYRQVPLLPNFSKREILCGIAAMLGANWLINDAGQLTLVRLNVDIDNIPYRYLVDESGNRILLGGEPLIV